MLQATAVDDGACGQPTAVHQLHATVVHHGGGRRAVNALQTAAVDQRAHGNAAHLDVLNAAIANNRVACHTRDLLRSTQQRRF